MQTLPQNRTRANITELISHNKCNKDSKRKDTVGDFKCDYIYYNPKQKAN